MNKVIFFGCVRTYTDNDSLVYLVEYMHDDGVTHRERINSVLYNNFKQKNIAPGTLVEGIFDVDSFNSLHLVDLNM